MVSLTRAEISVPDSDQYSGTQDGRISVEIGIASTPSFDQRVVCQTLVPSGFVTPTKANEVTVAAGSVSVCEEQLSVIVSKKSRISFRCSLSIR